MRLYFYCVFKGFKEGRLPMAGVGGQRIFHIQSKGLCAAVSPTMHRQYKKTVSNTAAHNSILKAYASHYPIIPYRFNTIVGERIGRGVLQRFHTDLLKELGQVGGRCQFHLKVFRRAALPGEKPVGSILAKSELRNRMREYLFGLPPLKSRPRKTYVLKPHVYAEMILAQLEPITDATREGSRANSYTVLDTFFLVQHKNQTQFAEILRTMISQLQELEFMVTGPEPPYDFKIVSLMNENTWPER